MNIIAERWQYPQTGMISGQGEAVRNTYHMHVGKSGRAWFVADRKDCASHVYCTAFADWDKTGEGFAGAHLTLELVDGTEFILKGGWHSNSDALFRDTGVDVRDRHLTYGAVGLRVSQEYMDLEDVLYQDSEPKLGSFNRIKEIAQRIADELGEMVFYSVKSLGGGSRGPIYPEKEQSE